MAAVANAVRPVVDVRGPETVGSSVDPELPGMVVVVDVVVELFIGLLVGTTTLVDVLDVEVDEFDVDVVVVPALSHEYAFS